MRRALAVFIVGLIVAFVLLPFVTWGLALVGGWNAAAFTILLTIWWWACPDCPADRRHHSWNRLPKQAEPRIRSG